MLRAAFVAFVAAPLFALAAQAETVRFAVTDMEGLEQLQQEFGPFRDALEAATGLDVELFPVASRTAAVEAMRAGQVEFVLTGPAEYVVIRELANPTIVAGWQRPNYFALVATLADGPYTDVAALRGQKVTFGSVGSTSQHLAPAQLLADFGLAYGADYEPVILNRNVAIEALIRGDVAAVSMNDTYLAQIREKFPDAAFTVVARGRDLPNDILVAASHTSEAAVNAVRAAFVEKGEALMNAVLAGEDNQKFRGGVFLADVDDADYDYVRAMYRTIGIETFGQFVGD